MAAAAFNRPGSVNSSSGSSNIRTQQQCLHCSCGSRGRSPPSWWEPGNSKAATSTAALLAESLPYISQHHAVCITMGVVQHLHPMGTAQTRCVCLPQPCIAQAGATCDIGYSYACMHPVCCAGATKDRCLLRLSTWQVESMLCYLA